MILSERHGRFEANHPCPKPRQLPHPSLVESCLCYGTGKAFVNGGRALDGEVPGGLKGASGNHGNHALASGPPGENLEPSSDRPPARPRDAKFPPLPAVKLSAIWHPACDGLHGRSFLELVRPRPMWWTRATFSATIPVRCVGRTSKSSRGHEHALGIQALRDCRR